MSERNRKNPYTLMTDDELEATHAGMVADLVARLEYFYTLPWPMGMAEVRKIGEAGPERFGMTRSEWSGHVRDVVEHHVECRKLELVDEARRERIRAAAREAASLEDPETPAGRERRERGPWGPAEGETVAEYVARAEREGDEEARERGMWQGRQDAWSGLLAALEEENLRTGWEELAWM